MAVRTELGVSRGIFRRLQVGLELRLERIVAAVSCAAIAVLGFAGSAYLQKTWRLGLLALLALLAAALIGRERIGLRPGAVAMVAAMGGLAGWTALSTFWADVPSMPPPEAERTLWYVVVILVVFVGCSKSSLPYLLGGVLAGITADCAYGLLRHLFWPPARSPIEGTLLWLPLGYANAVGIFAAVGVVLALGLALSATGWVTRAVLLAPLLVLVPTLSLTSSRGAWAALPFGLATLLFVGGRMRLRVLVPLLAAGVVAGVLLGSTGGQTLSVVGKNRPQYWHVAWKLYESNSLLGGGAGTFGNYWLHNRTNGEFVRDAHSLYIETLAELGPLGLALLLVALVAPLLALRRQNTMIAAAAAGAYVTFLLHAAVDWDWELPVVTIVGLTCGAALLVQAGSGRQLELGVRARGLLLAGASILAAFISAKLGAWGLVGLVGCKSSRSAIQSPIRGREERRLASK